MNLPLHIARRYLFSKKSHNAINIISAISVSAIAMTAMALITVLSVFNGFTDLASKTFSAFDPELQISAVKGKVFDPNDSSILKVKGLSDIAFMSESLEESALVRCQEQQMAVTVKGVSPNFMKQARIQDQIIDGNFVLRDGDVDHAVIGIGVAVNVGVRAGFLSPLTIYMPKRNERVQMANPATSFTSSDAFVSGIFQMNQSKYDDRLVIVSIDLARELLRYDNEVSTLDIKVQDGASVEAVQTQIQQLLGDEFVVKDRFQQQEDIYRMVGIEKWASFVILFILSIIAIFNIVGPLSMLIFEKKEDAKILYSMGATRSFVRRIFLYEGYLITFCGSLVGLLLGLAMCLIQQYFGVLKLGDAGAFLIDAYPVSVQMLDVLMVFVTINIVGFLAVSYTVNSLRKQI